MPSEIIGTYEKHQKIKRTYRKERITVGFHQKYQTKINYQNKSIKIYKHLPPSSTFFFFAFALWAVVAHAAPATSPARRHGSWASGAERPRQGLRHHSAPGALLKSGLPGASELNDCLNLWTSHIAKKHNLTSCKLSCYQWTCLWLWQIELNYTCILTWYQLTCYLWTWLNYKCYQLKPIFQYVLKPTCSLIQYLLPTNY